MIETSIKDIVIMMIVISVQLIITPLHVHHMERCVLICKVLILYTESLHCILYRLSKVNVVTLAPKDHL